MCVLANGLRLSHKDSLGLLLFRKYGPTFTLTIMTHTMTTYNASGYKMVKNQDTWEMERTDFLAHILVDSKLADIDTFEDREFFEGEVAMQLGCDWFELTSLEPTT